MDTTLRDGEQTSGVSFNAREKLSIARLLLEELRVSRIEIASARVSQGEQEAVRRIAEIDASEVVVNIRSTGGDVNDALLIHDALTALGAHITTRCYGYTASAATIIAQAASPGCREISANALYLIHTAVCATEGLSLIHI